MYRHADLTVSLPSFSPSFASSSFPSSSRFPPSPPPSLFLSSSWTLSIRNACRTCSPAQIAFVVAIAGMMFPAMPLAPYMLCGSMPKTRLRRFEADATNLMATPSSLSNSGRGGEGDDATSAKHAAISATQSDPVQTSVGLDPSRPLGGGTDASRHDARSPSPTGTGARSAVLYRSMPICFRISSAKRAARAARAADRTDDSAGAGGLASSPVGPTDMRPRSADTASMYVLFSPPAAAPSALSPLPFLSPPSPPSFSPPSSSAPSAFSLSAASESALRLSSSSNSMLSPQSGPKHSLYSSFAQTMQCTGWLGVLRIVHIG